MGLDILTGYVGAVVNHCVSSTKMREGLGHKALLLCVELLAFVIEVVCQHVEGMGALSGVTVVGISVVIIAMEVTSIWENVVAASPEGILVSDKEQSSYIKPYVSSFTQQVMFAEKSWGSFRIMDVEKESLTIKVTLNPGHKMNYHSHEFRDEVWTVIYGEGRAVIDGEERRVKAGDVLRMPAGCRHMLLADTELQVIEVQLGKDISVQDKKKYPHLKPL